jgi:hypothetical protein
MQETNPEVASTVMLSYFFSLQKVLITGTVLFASVVVVVYVCPSLHKTETSPSSVLFLFTVELTANEK